MKFSDKIKKELYEELINIMKYCTDNKVYYPPKIDLNKYNENKKMFFNHDSNKSIGKFDNLKPVSDDKLREAGILK